MTASEVYACGASNGFNIMNGNAFADDWTSTAGFDSIPPHPFFHSVTEACEWIAANFSGRNPCQTR